MGKTKKSNNNISTIIYPTLEGDYQARYRREDQNNNWINDNAYNKGGRHTNIIFNKSRTSTKIEAQLKGNQIITGRVNIVNVDSDAPTITSINNSGKSGNQIKVNITAKDNLSGLDGIYFTSSRITPSVNASGWIDFQTNGTSSKTYSRNFSIGTYYVYVKDKAGNISAGNKNGFVISNAIYYPERYYCPSGYTSSGSGSSMTCSKTTSISATYHAATEQKHVQIQVRLILMQCVIQIDSTVESNQKHILKLEENVMAIGLWLLVE